MMNDTSHLPETQYFNELIHQEAEANQNKDLTNTCLSPKVLVPNVNEILELSFKHDEKYDKEIWVKKKMPLSKEDINRNKRDISSKNGREALLKNELERNPKMMPLPWNLGSSYLPKSALSLNPEIQSVTIPPEGIKTIEDDRNQHTVFSLEVRLTSGLRWVIEKRYSDFREFHDNLKRSNPLVKQIYFPKKHIFRSKMQSVIDQRRIEFEKYIKDLLGLVNITRVQIFHFLEVYSHIESYERKRFRRMKHDDLERMKELLSPDELEDISQAFTRLCTPRTSMNFLERNISQDQLRTTSLLSTSSERDETFVLPDVLYINKNIFRRDILGVFHEMPSTFSSRFIRASADRTKNEISLDEFLRVIAIMLHGSDMDKLGFAFEMCDLDHSGKLLNTGLSNLLISLHGTSCLEEPELKEMFENLFDNGRDRLVFEKFIECANGFAAKWYVIDWMEDFANILIESPDSRLLDINEGFYPIAQQKILSSETYFNSIEVAILQECFNRLSATGSNDHAIDTAELIDLFPIGLTDAMLAKVFFSFGRRADGKTIDIFSFVNAISLACRGNLSEKSMFAFQVFKSSSRPVLQRDDLFAMLQQDISSNSSVKDLIWEYIDEQRPNVSFFENAPDKMGFENDLTANQSLSGSQLGIYVDFVMKSYGSDNMEKNRLELNLQQFSKWCDSISYESSVLNAIKLIAFIDLGLRPQNTAEEKEIASLCHKPYPKVPEMDLVEDENWYLIDVFWFRYWCKYAGLCFDEYSLEDATCDDKIVNSVIPRSTSNDTNDPTKPLKKPRPINNTFLFHPSETGEKVLKAEKDIRLNEHFFIICDKLWMALHAWYGGGPEICRRVVILPDGTTCVDVWENLIDSEAIEDPVSSSDGLRPSLANSIKRIRPGGSLGLTNLGNTCYLNSGLQCLTNTGLLAEYFLSGLYIDDINRNRAMGQQGKLADEYGKLTIDLWSSKKKAISPRNLKKTIAKVNDAFAGNDQQDSQELLAFLLSGLSEDLNRITSPPYIEQPDSDNRCDQDLADEWWRNHLRREVSIIVALFTGQYKSLLTCSNCEFMSARFEPFSFLQVPLPEPTFHCINIKIVFYSGVVPHIISLRLPFSSTIMELKEAICNISKSQFQMDMLCENIKVVEVSGSMVLGYKIENRQLVEIRNMDRLVAYQFEPLDAEIVKDIESCHVDILKKNSFEEIIKGNPLVEVKIHSHGSEYAPAVILSLDEENHTAQVQYRNGDIEWDVMYDRIISRRSRILFTSVFSRRLNYVPIYFKNPFRPLPFGPPEIIRFCPEKTTGYQLYMMIWTRIKRYTKTDLKPFLKEERSKFQKNQESKSIDSVFVSKNPWGFTLRRVDQKGIRDPRSNWLERSFGHEILCNNLAVDILEDESIAIDWDAKVFHDAIDTEEINRCIRLDNYKDSKDTKDKGPVPLLDCIDEFTTKENIKEGYCSGCQQHVELTKQLNIWRLPPIMIVHLKRFQYSQTYRRKLTTLVQFPLYNLDLKPYVAPLYDYPVPYPCKMVTSETSSKKISSSKESPKDNSSAYSSSSSSSHGKSKTRERRGYTDSNLDGSRVMETKYDLYAVVNHLGALGGGHYTAYAKNHVDGHWYCYDDDRVRLIEEEKVVSANAYLLFYIRTDMKSVSITDVYPQHKHEITEEDIQRFADQRDEKKCLIM